MLKIEGDLSDMQLDVTRDTRIAASLHHTEMLHVGMQNLHMIDVAGNGGWTCR